MRFPTVNPFMLLIKNARPGLLLAAALSYGLGAGVALHQGQTLRWPALLAGLGLLWLLLLGSGCLKRFYDPPAAAAETGAETAGVPDLARQQQEHLVFLLAGMTFWITGAGLTALLVIQGGLAWSTVILLMVAAALGLAWGVPPFRLVYSGYGELVETALVTIFAPLFGQLLLLDEVHPLLVRLLAPLFLTHLAMLLAFSLPHYATQLKHRQTTLIIRAGWEWGIRLHNGLLVAAFVLIPFLVLVGLPWAFAWRAFLALPLAAYQIWLMRAIVQGAPPNWRLLRLAAVTTWVLLVYQWLVFLWL
ncbi:MAG TPA: hypothetical protein PKG95_14480 [Anaerolineaceae bacterium]|nr:hypothetical protein [Anaerolineaceae bacterium]